VSDRGIPEPSGIWSLHPASRLRLSHPASSEVRSDEMLEKDILRLERALGTIVDHGASHGAVLAAPASVSFALQDLAGSDKSTALASLALRGARELRLVPELLRSLSDADGGVRHAAAVLLESTASEMGLGPFAPDAVEALIAALHDADRRVRLCAIGALAALRYGEPATVERVLREISRAVLDPADRRALFLLARALRSLLAQLPADVPPEAG